jgi:hypothetical protein
MNKPAIFLKAHVDTFTRKDGAVVQAHDTKVQAAAAPAPGEIGHHEHTEYGVYFRPGDKAKDREGNTHTVLQHSGPQVTTLGGATFHPTKLKKVEDKAGPEKPKAKTGKGSGKPGEAVTDASLKKHPMYEPSDHEYFKSKGYEPHEIKAIWDRDHALGRKPQAHEKAPDVVGVVADPDFYKKKAAQAKGKPSDERVNSDDAFDQIKTAAGGGANVKTSSGGINYAHKTGSATLAHRDEPDGSRTVSKRELDQHLAKLKGGDSKPALDPHPNVIGKATDVSKSGMFMKFGGKSYASTGKSGKSLHDGTPVEEYKHEDSGHRVWKDAQHRVHADSAEEAKKVRGEK